MVEGYPIVLSLVGKRCLVVGGGEVAERKVERLLSTQAMVTVISPRLTPLLEGFAKQGKITWKRRLYREGDVTGFFLVFAATNDPLVNQKVGEEAQKLGILCNLADNPKLSSFLTPAAMEWEGITVAISSGGKSPFLVGALRRWLEKNLPQGLGKLLGSLEEERHEIKKTTMTMEEKKRHYEKLLKTWEILGKGGSE